MDQELYNEIEINQGDEDRTTYIKKILVAHLEAQNTLSGTQGITDSNTDVAHLESDIKYLKKKLDEACCES